jgi:hypothetical protein
MPSSKPQNLLVPLIVFVVLWITSSATAFVFYQKSTKLTTELKNQSDRTKDAETKRAQADANIKTLKNLIGYPDAEFVAESDVPGGTSLISKIKEDLTKYVEPGTPASFSYKGEVDRLALRRDDLSKELESKNNAYARLREDFDTTRKAEEGKINENVASFQEAHADRERMEREVQQKIDEMTRQITDRQATADQKAAEAQQVAREFEGYRTKSERDRHKLTEQVQGFRESMQKLQAAGTPVGSVVSVDNLNDEVYIDRGSDDFLPLQTTFSIWSADKRGTMHWREKNEKFKSDARKEFEESGRSNVLEPRLEGGPKAYIEIVAILGPNQAKGRITMEKNIDPITPGDLLFTPLWEPGRRKHFALGGRFDMTGKGTNDRALLIDLIKRQGGVIDAEVKDNGTVEGAIEVGTSYLVIGDLSDEADSSDQQKDNLAQVRKRVDDLQKEAKGLGIEVIDQDKLYDFMGYKKFSRKYELGSYMGGPEPKDRFENPAQSTRPSGIPGLENPSAKGRPSGIPGRPARRAE